jgi:hypothetical protein
MRMLFLLLLLAVPFSFLPAQTAAAQETAWIQHTYEVRFRLKSIVSTTQVQANDASQAKKLVEAQYGKEIAVLSTKRLQKK